jgi:hypothetical protein
MNTKKTLLLFFTFIFMQGLMAQNGYKKNDLYMEFGGNGIVASLNYERQLTWQPGLGLRLGVGIVPLVGMSVPVGVNYLIKTKNENTFIEAGFGVTYLAKDEKKSGKIEEINFVPSIGYRRHTKRNSLFRINFTPILNKSFVFPIVGISFGKRF